MTRTRSVAIAALIWLSAFRSTAADELRVMTSGAFTAAYLELKVQFEGATHHTLITEATSMGTPEKGIAARLARGEEIDVVIVVQGDLERLMSEGHVRAGSRVDLAQSGIGMAVRRGAPQPDISTVEALRRALLEAQSIAYSSSVSGTYLSTELFQKLGIADQVLPKSRRVDGGQRVGAVVAAGDADIGFQQISELMPIDGIDYVGPLPAAVQRVSVVSAGIGARARYPETARRFIEFLASPTAAATIKKSALEPIAAQVPR